MDKTQNHFIDQFTPDKVGVFWFSNSPLDSELAGFHDFNYLCDGLIAQLLTRQPEMVKNNSNLFIGPSFDHPFFVAHINCNGLTPSQVSGEIDEQIAAVLTLKGEKNKVFVFDQSQGQWSNELKKRYSQFEFIELKTTT